LYNVPPFSYLDDNGNLTGYEIAILEAISVDISTPLEFVQVTGENALSELNLGRVDILVGEQTITRDAEGLYDFTHPHYLNQQRMVVLQAAPYQTFADLRGQTVSVVGESRGQEAAGDLLAQGFGYTLRLYYTEKDALDALVTGEAAAMVGELDNLQRAGRQGMRFIEQPVRLDPYSFAVRRYDVNLRNLLNRSLQRLWASGRLGQIYDQWFPADDLDFDVLLPVYEGVFADVRTVAQFPTDLPRPAESLAVRVKRGEALRVAGLSQNPNASARETLLDPFNRAMMDELARRWGITVTYLSNSAVNSVEFMVRGEADLAIGVTPRWDGADRFDYSRPYAVHGERLVVLEGSRFGSFRNFRGGSVIGFWYEDADDRERIAQIAEALRVNPAIYEFRSLEDITSQFNLRNVDGLFGDSLRLRALLTLLEPSGLPFKFVDEPYSRVPIVLALPRNDADFRALVDWTLQDMFLDGTYQAIYNATFGEGEPLVMLTWPGRGSWLRDEAP
jgi:ABC-type amino acid transport substrate-binding protein